jgi:hypothetical protein
MRELRFFGRFWLVQTGLLLLFAAIVGGGLLLTQNVNTLFGTYAAMFPAFVLLFPALLAGSGRTLRDAALSFGAKRMVSFSVRELLGAAQAALLVAAAKALEQILRTVPGGDDRAFGLGAGALGLLLLLSFAAVQAAFLLVNVGGGRHRALGWKIAAVFLIGGAMVVFFLVGRMGADPAWAMSPANPAWTAAMAGSAALALGLGLFAAQMEKKAVVSV